MRILVVGAGGIGGYFGGRLAAAGVDVTFLVRDRRYAQLQRDGLRIASPLGNVTVPVRAVVAAKLTAAHDVVLLTCKAYDLDSAMDAIAPVMQGTACILPLLNGMTHLDSLDARFGRAKVLGGTCAISASLQEDGLIAHATTIQRVIFGERDGSLSPRVSALADAFARTALDWELSREIVQDLWEKVVFLSAAAAMTCLFRANIGEVLAAAGGREAIRRTLAANTETATRAGHAPRAPAVAFAAQVLSDPASTLSASMLRDMESGARVEADHIVGWMLDQARSHGTDDTMLSLAYTHLKAYEGRRAAGRVPH